MDQVRHNPHSYGADIFEQKSLSFFHQSHRHPRNAVHQPAARMARSTVFRAAFETRPSGRDRSCSGIRSTDEAWTWICHPRAAFRATHTWPNWIRYPKCSRYKISVLENAHCLTDKG